MKHESALRSDYTLGVVIVNYNYAQYVGQAIESVLGQSPAFDEVVVVDDGSTDQSREVIASFQPRVKVIHQANAGALGATLSGFRAIHTDYVYVLDADDYVCPGMVATVRRHLQGAPVKLQFQLAGLNLAGEPTGTKFPTYAADYGSRQMMEDNRIAGFYQCPTTSANVFSRKAINQLDFQNVSLRDFIDGPPALAMPYLGAVASVNEVIAHYRIHGKNHSRWDQPDAALLRYEIDWFYRRWADVAHLLRGQARPFGNEQPLYVLERNLMLAVLENRPVLSCALHYMQRLVRANFPLKQRLMLAFWSVALLLPIPAWRRKFVFARRSPLHRPKFLQSLVRLLTGGRRRSGAVPLHDSIIR